MAIPVELSFSSEQSFRDSFLMPLLQRLGFSIVVNYHGSREFGRDIVFGELDRFGHVIYFAMQAKYEPSISQAASHDLIRDAREAFNHPFRHPQTGVEHFILAFYVATAGTISDQASENFFNTLANERIRHARLLDGPGLLLLDRWASISRGTLIRERINGMLMEIRMNRRVFSTLPDMMKANIYENAPFPVQRARLNATGSFLESPVFSERVNVSNVELYYESGRIVNRLADEIGGTQIEGSYKQGRLNGIIEYAPAALLLGNKVADCLEALLGDLGPLAQ